MCVRKGHSFLVFEVIGYRSVVLITSHSTRAIISADHVIQLVTPVLHDVCRTLVLMFGRVRAIILDVNDVVVRAFLFNIYSDVLRVVGLDIRR